MRSIKAALATILVPGLGCVLAPYTILRATHLPLDSPIWVLQILAIVIAALGWGMIIWVSYAFVSLGKGTPIPIEPPTRLVVSGLYRYLRNPMYTGALLVILAEALYFGALALVLYAAGLCVVFQTFLVWLEEPQLKRRFGGAYLDYLNEVPRWMPRLRRS